MDAVILGCRYLEELRQTYSTKLAGNYLPANISIVRKILQHKALPIVLMGLFTLQVVTQHCYHICTDK